MAALIAFICFLAAAIWFVVSRSWPMVLLATGLLFLLLDIGGPITIGD